MRKVKPIKLYIFRKATRYAGYSLKHPAYLSLCTIILRAKGVSSHFILYRPSALSSVFYLTPGKASTYSIVKSGKWSTNCTVKSSPCSTNCHSPIASGKCDTFFTRRSGKLPTTCTLRSGKCSTTLTRPAELYAVAVSVGRDVPGEGAGRGERRRAENRRRNREYFPHFS